MEKYDIISRFEIAKEVISSVRNIRQKRGVSNKEVLTLQVIVDENFPKEFTSVIEKNG